MNFIVLYHEPDDSVIVTSIADWTQNNYLLNTCDEVKRFDTEKEANEFAEGYAKYENLTFGKK